ncbi:hypothetical protein RAS1_24930 [Phycisphaerae bacterium RAS1]|nr:hypothetical protein RAS1_24930 [Phycisphaerae bacterium RAS1]
MNEADRPPKPDPRCTWDERHAVWVWPDDRTPEQKSADDEIAHEAETRDWELEEFLERHSEVPKP